MALEKRTIRIIIIIAILLIACIIGLAVGLRSSGDRSIHLQYIPHDDSGSELIYYKSYDKGSVLKWTNIINDSLAEYRNKRENQVTCSAIFHAKEGQVCDVPLETFAPCIRENEYNYHRGGPCVFLRMNKMKDWIPAPYNRSQDLPLNMTQDLKQHIAVIAGGLEANAVWVSCEGVDDADVENIGPMQYIPRRGFPSYYFPYSGQEGYLSPLVAVLFERPKVGILIKVECKLWAKNILYNHDAQRGSVVFNLMVD